MISRMNNLLVLNLILFVFLCGRGGGWYLVLVWRRLKSSEGVWRRLKASEGGCFLCISRSPCRKRSSIKDIHVKTGSTALETAVDAKQIGTDLQAIRNGLNFEIEYLSSFAGKYMVQMARFDYILAEVIFNAGIDLGRSVVEIQKCQNTSQYKEFKEWNDCECQLKARKLCFVPFVCFNFDSNVFMTFDLVWCWRRMWKWSAYVPAQ